MEVVSWRGIFFKLFLSSSFRARARSRFFSLLPLSLSLSLFPLSLSLLSLSLSLSLSFSSYAKVVPTTLDASVVGGRASREADAKIKAAEGGQLPLLLPLRRGTRPPPPLSRSTRSTPTSTPSRRSSRRWTPRAPRSLLFRFRTTCSPLTLSLSRPKTPLCARRREARGRGWRGEGAGVVPRGRWCTRWPGGGGAGVGEGAGGGAAGASRFCKRTKRKPTRF